MSKAYIYFSFVLIILGCQPDINIPENPPLKGLTWETYHDPVLNYTIQKPLSYQAEMNDGETIFLYQGTEMMIIQYATESALKEKLLWQDRNRVGKDSVFAELADVYRLDRVKKNEFSPAIGYAFPYRDKIFSIAFRTRGKELDPTQKMMLRTYRYYIPGDKF